jgi:hypothetical protein
MGVRHLVSATAIVGALACTGGTMGEVPLDAGAATSDGGAPNIGDAAAVVGDGGAVADPDAAARPPLRDDGLDPPPDFRERVERALDRATLGDAFAAAGWSPPDGTEVYAARIVEGVGGPAYVVYEHEDGAFSQDYWPASTIKLLASLGALDHLRSRGFTGEATVAFDTGFTDTMRAIYGRAIRVSSNIDYDRAVRIAGLDRLNDVFLVPENGFEATAIQSSYSGIGVVDAPGFTLSEGGRSEHVAAMTGRRGRCTRGNNCTTLFELVEAVRRVVLDAEIPEAERFDLHASDVRALTDALCTATPSFFAAGAERAFGSPARICHKPGWVPDLDCLDHGLVEDTSTETRYLLAAAIPDRAGRSDCLPAAPLAEHALRGLAASPTGPPLQPDAGIDITVQIDDLGSDGTDRRPHRLVVDADGAAAVELWVDASVIGRDDTGGPRFELEHAFRSGGERLVSVRALGPRGEPLGFRALRAAIAAP